jgi:hypothetical protein
MIGRYVYNKSPYQAYGRKKENEENQKVRKITGEEIDDYHSGRAN